MSEPNVPTAGDEALFAISDTIADGVSDEVVDATPAVVVDRYDIHGFISYLGRTGLSASSQLRYIRCAITLTKMSDQAGRTLSHMATPPFLDLLRARSPSNKSYQTSLSTLLHIVRFVYSGNEEAEPFIRVRSEISRIAKVVHIENKEAEMSAKQAALSATIDRVLPIRMAKLRAEMGTMGGRMAAKVRSAKMLLFIVLSEALVRRTGDIRMLTLIDDGVNNYFDIDTKTILFRRYKTSSTYGEDRQSAPEEAISIARKLLQWTCCRFLFFPRCNPGSASPISEQAMTQFAKAAYGIDGYTPTLRRKIYATSMADRRQVDAAFEAAAVLKHSVATFAESYCKRRRLDDTAASDVQMPKLEPIPKHEEHELQ